MNVRDAREKSSEDQNIVLFVRTPFCTLSFPRKWTAAQVVVPIQCQRRKEFPNETDFPATQQEAPQYARFPCPHGNQKRAQSSGKPARQRPAQAHPKRRALRSLTAVWASRELSVDAVSSPLFSGMAAGSRALTFVRRTSWLSGTTDRSAVEFQCRVRQATPSGGTGFAG